jgi:hypothetical protein
MTEIQKESLESAIRGFDFTRVRTVMKALNWTWLGEEDTPTVGDMMYTVQELAEDIAKHDEGYAATGGFEVEWDGEIFIIRFVAEESKGYVD